MNATKNNDESDSDYSDKNDNPMDFVASMRCSSGSSDEQWAVNGV